MGTNYLQHQDFQNMVKQWNFAAHQKRNFSVTEAKRNFSRNIFVAVFDV